MEKAPNLEKFPNISHKQAYRKLSINFTGSPNRAVDVGFCTIASDPITFTYGQEMNKTPECLQAVN